MKLNTSWIDESENDTINDLLNSQRVWITVDGNITPATIKTSNVELKNGVATKLINYSIDFEFSFNTRNTVY